MQSRAAPGAGEIRAARLLPGQVRLVGTGAALAPELRGPLEQFFREDLATVRVHEGPAASSIGAAAFTLGEDIYFAPGLFAPQTPAGLELLGHELTHVVQQRQGRVQNPFSDGVAVVQDPALEAEADQVGRMLSAYMADSRRGASSSAGGMIGATSLARPCPPSTRAVAGRPGPAAASATRTISRSPFPTGAWPAEWIRSVTSVAQPSTKVLSGGGGFNFKGGVVPGSGKKGGGGGRKGGGGGKKGGGGGKKHLSKKRQQGIGGVQSTSYRWNGGAWVGASGPHGAAGAFHAEQVAYFPHAFQNWVGITQNAFPCADQCIAAFDLVSNAAQAGGGIVFNITADHGGYSVNWANQATPCTIYFVGGAHAVRAAAAGEPGAPP